MECWDGPGAHVLDKQFVDHLPCAGNGLAPGAHVGNLLEQRLKTPAVSPDGVTHGGAGEDGQLSDCLHGERSWHAGVALEMPVVEPFLIGEAFHGLNVAPPPRTASGVALGNLIEQQHQTSLQARRTGVVESFGKKLAKTVHHAIFAEGPHFIGVEDALVVDHRRRIERPAGTRRALGWIPKNTARAFELGLAEKSGLTVSYRRGHLAVHPAVRIEKEQPHGPYFGKPAAVDVHNHTIADLQHATKGDGVNAQEPVDPLALVFKVYPKPGDQKQVCLAHLQGDTGWHMAVVQVPGVFFHHRFGPELSRGAHGARLGVDPEHGIGQQKWRHGHAHHRVVLVYGLKLGAKNLGDFVGCKNLQLLAPPLGARQHFRHRIAVGVAKDGPERLQGRSLFRAQGHGRNLFEPLRLRLLNLRRRRMLWLGSL